MREKNKLKVALCEAAVLPEEIESRPLKKRLANNAAGP